MPDQGEQRFLAIAAQFEVSQGQLLDASQNASKFTSDINSEGWYNVFAASLEAFEEENMKRG